MDIHLDRGILIAFEGIDGAGKTTQANRLLEFLRAKGFQAILTKEPTKGPYGQQIRESARTGRLAPEEELALFLKDRQEHVRSLLRPQLARGTVILVDRYYFSTAAYQGARGLDPEFILAQNEQFAPAPDLLVILDVDAETGLSRVEGRGDQADLFENASELTRARAIFDSLDKSFLLRLDGTLSIDELERRIRERLYHGPIKSRLCLDVSSGVANYCSHQFSGICDWIQVGEGFEDLPLGPLYAVDQDASAR